MKAYNQYRKVNNESYMHYWEVIDESIQPVQKGELFKLHALRGSHR